MAAVLLLAWWRATSAAAPDAAPDPWCAECNYNGRCLPRDGRAASSCLCDAAWRGQACDELALEASDASLGYQGRSEGQNVTSWGGSVVVADDGTFHMYAAEITGHCGMNVWLSNSQVIHASSPDPRTVPFERVGVVAPVFAHEPIAARAPTGEFVVYYTAVPPPLPLPVKGGLTCTNCSHGRSPALCGTDSNRNASIMLPTFMVWSKDPAGPWSIPIEIPGTDVFADSNFAPVINKNGSVVGLMRGNVIAADHWRDPESYRVAGQWHDEGEDPMVYKDPRGVYHNIVHVKRANTHGLHYYSVDGVNWTAAAGQACECMPL
jgi:hypothetical protein